MRLFYLTLVSLFVIFLPIFFVLASGKSTCSITQPCSCQGGNNCNCCELKNPLGDNVEDINTLLGRAINAALGVVGSIALAMFIYGGITWMISGGNSEKAGKGKNIIIWAILGMVVIFSAYAMVNFVFNDVLGLSASKTPPPQS